MTAVLPSAALEAYGWRIAFLLGAVAVPFGFWLRTNLPETLHGSEDHPVQQAPRGQQAWAHRRVLALSVVVLGSGTIANYVAAYIVTYTQATLHMTARIGFVASTSGYAIGIASVLLGGWLSDKYGRRPINLWGNFVSLLMIYPVFAWITATRSDFTLIASITLLSAAQNFIWGSYYAGLSESLPQTIRGSGFGIVYSLALAIFGGTTQLVVTWLIHLTGSPMAPAWYMLGAAAAGQIALMMFAESAPVRVALTPQVAGALP